MQRLEIFGVHAGKANIHLSIEGRDVRFSCPADAIDAGLAFAPEDRKRDGLVLEMSPQQNATLAYRKCMKHWACSIPRSGLPPDPRSCCWTSRPATSTALMDVQSLDLQGRLSHQRALARASESRVISYARVLFSEQRLRGE